MTQQLSESTYQQRLSSLREQIEARTGKSAQELYAEKEQRLRAAIQLEEPDRVPVIIPAGNFAARYGGLPLSTAYYDVASYIEANVNALVDFEPDFYRRIAGAASGMSLDALEAKHMRWPGGSLSPELPYQFVEGQYMKGDEYDSIPF